MFAAIRRASLIKRKRPPLPGAAKLREIYIYYIPQRVKAKLVPGGPKRLPAPPRVGYLPLAF